MATDKDKDKERKTKMANANAKKKAKHGEGCLVKRGKTYYARWMVEGKVFTRSTGESVEREAKKKLAEFVAPFAAKTDKERLENLAVKIEGRKAEIREYEDSKPALALADGFEAYRKSRARPDTGAATLNMYESQYNRLVRWAEQNVPNAREMRNFTRSTADAFATYLAGELSPNSFNKYITLFKRMWDVLADEGRITENPWAKIRHIALAPHTRRELTVEELARVCGLVTGEMRLLFAVGIYTGLRLGDCATLEWGSIDLARNRIMIIPRKTARHSHGKPVKIPLHPTLTAMLAEVPPSERTGYLLPETADVYQRNSSLISSRIQAVFEKAGIRTQTTADGERAKVDVGFHSLRHTFVSLSANAGTPLAVVQAIVGHSTPTMTLHYFHESDTALQSAVAALPSISADGITTAETPSLPAHLLAALDGLSKEELVALQGEIAKRL